MNRRFPPARSRTHGHAAIPLPGAAVLLGACARYVPAPIAPAETAAALDARTLEAPRPRRSIAAVIPEDDADTDRRWDVTALTLAALYYHPDLELRRAGPATTRAAAVTAAQRPNPALSLNPLRHLDALAPSAVDGRPGGRLDRRDLRQARMPRRALPRLRAEDTGEAAGLPT